MSTALHVLVTEPWDDYGLIDSGHGRKLERYGSFRFIRPETAGDVGTGRNRMDRRWRVHRRQ